MEHMPTISLETPIHAPPERCFDAARNVELHLRSTSSTQERAVAGVTTGLLTLGDVVTWEAVHFGIKQRLTVKITAYDRPYRFVDEQVQGIFTELCHIHEFKPTDDGTLMIDHFSYTAPLSILGVVADHLFLERYMRAFLQERNAFLKHSIENEKHDG